MHCAGIHIKFKKIGFIKVSQVGEELNFIFCLTSRLIFYSPEKTYCYNNYNSTENKTKSDTDNYKQFSTEFIYLYKETVIVRKTTKSIGK